MPLALAIFRRAVDRGLGAGDHDLSRRIVVGDDADAAGRRGAFLRQLFGLFDFGAEQRAHAALADRHGALHRLAARFQQPRRVGEREGAGGAERGVFAERMTGDEARMLGEIEARLRAPARG